MEEDEAELGCIVETIERRSYGRLGVTLVPGATPERRDVVRRSAAVAMRMAQAVSWQAVESGRTRALQRLRAPRAWRLSD